MTDSLYYKLTGALEQGADVYVSLDRRRVHIKREDYRRAAGARPLIMADDRHVFIDVQGLYRNVSFCGITIVRK